MSPRILITDAQKVGWRKALASFNRRRHLLPIIGYLILTCAIALAFTQERAHSNQNRHQLAQETRLVLIQGCERQNVLRVTLSDLVAKNISEVKRLVREGTLTPTQGKRSIASTHDALKQLAPTDCQSAYGAPPRPR